jgi:hypothetical protein
MPRTTSLQKQTNTQLKLSPINPTEVQPQPQPISQNQPTLLQAAKEGFALGAGSAIGNRIMNSVVDSIGKIISSSPASTTAPTTTVTDFKNCMEKTYDYDTCKSYLSKDQD